MQRGRIFIKCSIFVLCTGILFGSNFAQASSFRQLYQRGKIYLKQRQYAKAVRLFHKAIHKPRGKSHFAIHYYFARACVYLDDISKAHALLSKSKKLIKNNAQRRVYKKLLRYLQALFGKWTISPEVDPDDVGRLIIDLKSTKPFGHGLKRRAYRYIRKRWKRFGLKSLEVQSVYYLPKGTYRIRIRREQGSKFLFYKGLTPITKLTIGQSTTVQLKKNPYGCYPGTGNAFQDRRGNWI